MLCFCMRFDVFYNARMASTGFFFAAVNTGRNVAIAEVTAAMASSINADVPPNTKIEALRVSLISLLIKLHPATLPAMPRTRQINAMTNDSE